jgi:Domain of unknown function (DUF4340)
MKFKSLLIAVAVLAVVGGASYYSEKREKAAEGQPSKDAPPKILSLPEDQFNEIRLQRLAGEVTVVRKSPAGKWEIVEPKPYAVDPDAVSSLVNALASLTSDVLVDEKPADLGPFGLKTPSLEVTITKKDGKVEKLLVGDDTPTSSGAYVTLVSSPRVYTIASYVKSNIDKYAKDLRDKRLLTADFNKLTRVELDAKGAPIEFGKNTQGEWQIVKPRPLRADVIQVDEVVRSLKDAKMDLSPSDEEAAKIPSEFASATRVASATVTDAGGDQRIEVRKDKANNYYAKSSAVDGIYKVASTFGEGLDKDLASFRNKKLFDFGFAEPSKVAVNKAVYIKSDDKWMKDGKQMDTTTVQGLLDKMRDLSAAELLDTAPQGVPVFEATVTSNDGKRVETVSIVKQGETYAARRENEGGGYEIDKAAFDDLQKAASGVKEFQPPKDQKKK